MEDRIIYLFFDWVMTCNELVAGEKVKQSKFNRLLNSIERIESKLNAKARLIIVTGSSNSTAKNIVKILLPMFKRKNRRDIFVGVAYEYGGYIANSNCEVTQILTYDLSKTNRLKIASMLQNYPFKFDNDYTMYCSVKFDNFDKDAKSFIQDCKVRLRNVEFETFNDKYGAGIDIKNFRLNKCNFVKTYLTKQQKPLILIFAGDSEEDLSMFNSINKVKKFFISLLENEIAGYGIINSNKKNIDAVIEGLNKIYKEDLEE